jgi:hypothetical protein
MEMTETAGLFDPLGILADNGRDGTAAESEIVFFLFGRLNLAPKASGIPGAGPPTSPVARSSRLAACYCMNISSGFLHSAPSGIANEAARWPGPLS